MLNKLIKVFEVQTTKSVDEILTGISDKVDYQRANKNFLIQDEIKYRSFKIDGNKIEIERYTSLFSPFRGSGEITFELNTQDYGTQIICTVDPIKLGIYVSIGMIVFVLLAMIIPIWIIGNYWSILYILAFGLIPIGLSYQWGIYNRNQLEDLSRQILNDLKLNNEL
jgi:hypothetical protein